MFIRRIFEGEYTACVTSKLCLEGIGAIVPDLQVNRFGVSAREVGQGKKGTPHGDTLVLAATVYVVIARGDTKY